jgi:branched-chain amino acid transport system ATP-binding protein
VSALAVEGMRKRFGALAVTQDVSLTVEPGEVHALIGPNGAGKTTLIAQVAGSLAPDAGVVRLGGRDVTALPEHARARLGLARTFQITSVFPELTALENAALAAQAASDRPGRMAGRVADDPALTGAALAALAETGLTERAHAPARTLAHGEKRALELAMALAQKPGVLLLDEPMAGAGRDETERLTATLARLKGRVAMLLVEHDMGAVFALADRVSVLVAGRLVATGAPAAIRADPAVRAAYLGEDG